MSDNKLYEASVYSFNIDYRNFNGQVKTATLNFSMHPLQLMEVFSSYKPRTIKSGNPSINGKSAEMTDEDQIKMVQRLAGQAAGTPTEDGEAWIPFEDFTDSIAGKAFLTRLVSSDQTRREFSEKVLLDPFRAFMRFARQDPTNSPKEIAELENTLKKMEDVFKTPEPYKETDEERRARLHAELAKLEGNTEVNPN